VTDGPSPSQQLRDANKQPPDPRDVVAWRIAKTVWLWTFLLGACLNLVVIYDGGVLRTIGTTIIFLSIPIGLGTYFVGRAILGAPK
jgi:hypothetical protein